jgi:uncharacterized protein YcbK (DUF882 family)
VISLARLLQAFRSRIGRPVVLTSVYRNADYNAAIGGAANSQHIQFRAADFVVPGFSSPLHWASVLRELREGGVFAGAIGTYAGFVHVDTRGQNIDFP